MDHVKNCVPEGHGVGPAKPQHKGLCDVHALRAHHGNNVFEQGGGGRSTNNLLPDTERQMSRLNVRKSQVLQCFLHHLESQEGKKLLFVSLKPF